MPFWSWLVKFFPRILMLFYLKMFLCHTCLDELIGPMNCSRYMLGIQVKNTLKLTGIHWKLNDLSMAFFKMTDLYFSYVKSYGKQRLSGKIWVFPFHVAIKGQNQIKLQFFLIFCMEKINISCIFIFNHFQVHFL